MRSSEQAIELIKDFEGLRTSSYMCIAGYKTIGYGHVLVSNDARDSINQMEAEDLLLEDIKKAEKSVLRNIMVELTQGQFDALVSFTFNLGAAALQRSTLRQKINRQEYESVPKEFMRWVYAGGQVIPGLIRRRRAELGLYVS